MILDFSECKTVADVEDVFRRNAEQIATLRTANVALVQFCRAPILHE